MRLLYPLKFSVACVVHIEFTGVSDSYRITIRALQSEWVTVHVNHRTWKPVQVAKKVTARFLDRVVDPQALYEINMTIRVTLLHPQLGAVLNNNCKLFLLVIWLGSLHVRFRFGMSQGQRLQVSLRHESISTSMTLSGTCPDPRVHPMSEALLKRVDASHKGQGDDARR